MTATWALGAITTLSDNAYTTDQTNYRESSPLARWIFVTTATHVFIKIYDTLYGTFPDWAEIGVYVNGVYYQTIPSTAANDNVLEADLPAGLKIVEFITSLQSKQAATLRGTFLKSIYLSGGVSNLSGPVISPMVVYGDSITVGSNSITPAQDAWTMIVRQSHPLIIEAWGYRSLNTDCSDAAARTAFAARLASYSPSVIWLAIGLNDYILETMNAANFEIAYSDFLDKLHAARPTAIIYCQTMIPKTANGANALGSTLENYRTAIVNAQSSRSTYCILVNGTMLVSPSNLDVDGTHPNTTGHAEYAGGVLAVL